jgi:hypothetical protein
MFNPKEKTTGGCGDKLKHELKLRSIGPSTKRLDARERDFLRVAIIVQ